MWVLCAGAPPAAAQEWDPASAVSAYSAALNAHDLPAALAMFDEYSSATDAAGHHFEGPAGLTDFLLASGFGNPDAHITTVSLRVAGNRAIWTYACSCTTTATDARLVLSRDKISVFFILAPPARPVSRPNAGVLPSLIGLALLASVLAGSLALRHRQTADPAPRQSQGHLLAALQQWRDQPPVGVSHCDAESLDLR